MDTHFTGCEKWKQPSFQSPSGVITMEEGVTFPEVRK